MIRNIHKSTHLANTLFNQNLLRPFVFVGTNNNYSIRVKKENFVNIPTNLFHNKLMMNIDGPGFRNYSSSSVNNSNKITTQVNPVVFKHWSIEEVCSLLCTPKEKGGAGLSMEQVISLYDAGFKAKSLGNIVTCIQEKDGFVALDETCNSFPTVAPDTLKSIVVWVNNLLNKTIVKAPDCIVEARKDSKFEYLRGLKNNDTKWKELELRIGQNIELPILSDEVNQYVPKDYDCSRPYLLTKQRFDILKQVVEREQDGYVFSGPHGVSKSYTMILIAAYAIVNSLPLLYIPKCGKWIDCFFIDRHEQFLKESFQYYNSDILDSNQTEMLNTTDVMHFLKTLTTDSHSIFYLFDEHNEIFTKNVQNHEYFQSFTCWNGNTSSNKSMTIYCGSPHSKFEDNLPKESKSRVIRITPLNFSEFKVMVQDFGFFNLSNDHLLKIENATGRIPGEVKIFSEQVPKNFTDNEILCFTLVRQGDYERRLQKLKRDSTPSEIQGFLSTINCLFNLGFLSDHSRRESFNGKLYDQGTLYMNSSCELYPINEAAKRALFKFYTDFPSYYPKETVESLQLLGFGSSFECLMIRNEYKKGETLQRFLKTGRYDSEQIEYNITSQASIDLNNLHRASSLSRKRWFNGESILFVPEKQHFPVIDYLVVTYSEKKIQIVFKQATITTVKQNYDYGDFTRLLKPAYLVGENDIFNVFSKLSIEENGVEMKSKYTYSLLELIIHSILDNYNECSPVVTKGKDGHQTKVMLREKIFNYNYKPTKTKRGNKSTKKIKLERKLKVGDVEILWYFVYESFVERNKQDINIAHNLVNYRNREEIEDFLSISNIGDFDLLR